METSKHSHDHPKEHSDDHSNEHPAMTFEEADKHEPTVTFTTRELLHKINTLEKKFAEGHSSLNPTLLGIGRQVGKASHRGSVTGVVISRPRRNHLSLSPDERKKFNTALEATITSGVYAALVAIHKDMSHNQHGFSMAADPALGKLRFLSWHRAYLFQLERALGKSLRIPYWDWANDHQLPTWVHQPSGVTRGPDTTRTLPTQAMVDSQVLDQPTYVPFTSALEQAPFHNAVHMWAGGTMQDPMHSPEDPLFWLHHANCDRIWAQWQEVHPSGEDIMEWMNWPPLSGVSATMDPWTLRVEDLRSTYDLYYYYE